MNKQTTDNDKSYEGWFLLIIGGIIFFALFKNDQDGGVTPPQPEIIPQKPEVTTSNNPTPLTISTAPVINTVPVINNEIPSKNNNSEERNIKFINFKEINEDSFNTFSKENQLKYLNFIKHRVSEAINKEPEIIFEKPQLKEEQTFVATLNGKRAICLVLRCEIETSSLAQRYCKYHSCEHSFLVHDIRNNGRGHHHTSCSNLKASANGIYLSYCHSHYIQKERQNNIWNYYNK